MTAVLAAAVVAAGVYGVDQMRVGVAQATLQNRVSLAAGETRDQIKHNSQVIMELTCGEETQSKALQLDDSQLTQAYITTQVPADCEMTDLRLSSVRAIPPEPRQLNLESPQFSNGTAQVAVKQTATGIEITATGKATAGWFKREISATAQVQVDAVQARQKIQDRLVAVLEGRDEVQVAANEPAAVAEPGAAQTSTGDTEAEPEGSTAPEAREPEKPATANAKPTEPGNPAANTPAASEPEEPVNTTPAAPEPETPGSTTPAAPEPETGDSTPAATEPETPGDTTPTTPETPGNTAPEQSEPENPGDAAQEEPEPASDEGVPTVEPFEPAPGPEPGEPPAGGSEPQPQTPEELSELWNRNLMEHLQSRSQEQSPAPSEQ